MELQPNAVRLIPTEDRKRELIAARHTARITRLFGTSQKEAPEPQTLPVWLSSEETIGLFAYGRVNALCGPVPGAPPMFERWSSHCTGYSTDDRLYPLVREMRLVLARAWWWKRQRRKHAPAVPCPIPRLQRIPRAHIRALIHRQNTTAVVMLARLRTDVRQWIKACQQHELAIEHATAALCAEVAAGNLTAWGRRGVWSKRQYTSGIHDEIPAVFFANPDNTIQADGWATCGWDITAENWANWNGPDWGDVRFKRDEVLVQLDKLVPKEASPTSKPAGQIQHFETSTASAAFEERLATPPAWLTPMQAIAWIASRSIKIIHYAGPDGAQVRLSLMQSEDPDRDCFVDAPQKLSLLWLDLYAASEVAAVPAEIAKEQLLRALRAGELIARGEWVHSGERRDITTDDWMAMSFDTPPRQEWCLLPYRTDGHGRPTMPDNRWRNVLLPTERCRVLWPFHDHATTSTTENAGTDLPAMSDNLAAVVPRRKIQRIDFAVADAALMPEMDRLMTEGLAGSPYQAGIALSGKAAGGGSVVTKAKRLAGRYKQWVQAGEPLPVEHD